MHKDLSSTLSKKNLSGAQGGWNEAIAEAERQIAEATQRARKLKGVIQTFKQLRDEGAQLPLCASETNER
jgi:hypothetical protein